MDLLLLRQFLLDPLTDRVQMIIAAMAIVERGPRQVQYFLPLFLRQAGVGHLFADFARDNEALAGGASDDGIGNLFPVRTRRHGTLTSSAGAGQSRFTERLVPTIASIVACFSARGEK